jgi:hypothetical protein
VCVFLHQLTGRTEQACLFSYWQARLKSRLCVCVSVCVHLLTGTSKVKCVCSVIDKDNCTQGCAYLLTGTAEVTCVCACVHLLTGTSKVKCVCSVTDRDNCSQGCAYLLTGTNRAKRICSLTDRHDCRQICVCLVTGTTEVGRVCLSGTTEGRWIPLLTVKYDLNQVYRFTYTRIMSVASVR